MSGADNIMPTKTQRNGNGIKRDKNGRWVEGTAPPNPAGRPPLGESWREIFSAAGKLTRRELTERYPTYGKRLNGLPDDVPLRDAVALSALVTLACEPSPGLLSAIMERVDGKVADDIRLRLDRVDDAELAEEINSILARLGFSIIPPDTERVATTSDQPDGDNGAA